MKILSVKEKSIKQRGDSFILSTVYFKRPQSSEFRSAFSSADLNANYQEFQEGISCRHGLEFFRI